MIQIINSRPGPDRDRDLDVKKNPPPGQMQLPGSAPVPTLPSTGLSGTPLEREVEVPGTGTGTVPTPPSSSPAAPLLSPALPSPLVGPATFFNKRQELPSRPTLPSHSLLTAFSANLVGSDANKAKKHPDQRTAESSQMLLPGVPEGAEVDDAEEKPIRKRD